MLITDGIAVATVDAVTVASTVVFVFTGACTDTVSGVKFSSGQNSCLRQWLHLTPSGIKDIDTITIVNWDL
jgi:hypothetical protein